MNNKEFFWGVSTSAFQIEGDDGNQGRGKSVWDVFCEKENVIYKNHNAKIAANHYERYVEDLDLMKTLGVNAYRFSTSWTRILPDGIGKINEKGIDFYDRLIDGALSRGITPFLTFYHWDLPQKLFEKNGFLNRDFSKWFAEYVQVVVDKFGDRVFNYITFNEPINVISSSFHKGVFAPALTLSEQDTLKCTYNYHQAHSLASKIIAERSLKNVVGVAVSTFENYPINPNDDKCVEMARNLFFSRSELAESIDLYLDPLLLNKYPDRVFEKYPDLCNYIDTSVVAKFYNKNNILCYNNYSGNAVNALGEEIEDTLDVVRDINGRAIDTNGLYWGAKFLTERYNLPIYITENGITSHDSLSADGKVHDTHRVDFLSQHLKVVDKIYEEMDLKGYFVWSLCDNFEWLAGYSERYGLIHIDFDTLKRTPKDSFYFYKNYIKNKKW